MANAVCVGGACSWCDMLWHREHGFIISAAVQSSLKPIKEWQIQESVPRPGCVCSGCCNHAWLQLCPWPGTPAWHLCVIHGNTVLSWSLSFPMVPFLYSHTHIVVIYSDLSIFFHPAKPILVLLRIHRNPCALCVTTCSVVQTAWVLGTLCPCSGRYQIKIKNSHCYSAAGLGDLQSLAELSLVPDDVWFELLGVLSLFQLSPSVPKHSSCWWFFLGKGCQITLNCVVMSSKESRDKTTKLFFTWLNQALYLAHGEHQAVSHPLSSRQFGFAEWHSIIYEKEIKSVKKVK